MNRAHQSSVSAARSTSAGTGRPASRAEATRCRDAWAARAASAGRFTRMAQRWRSSSRSAAVMGSWSLTGVARPASSACLRDRTFARRNRHTGTAVTLPAVCNGTPRARVSPVGAGPCWQSGGYPGSTRMRRMLSAACVAVAPRSLEPYPRRPSNEPHCSRRRASAQDGTGTVRPISQPGWLPGAASPRTAHARLAGAEPGIAAPIAWPSTRRLGRWASRCYRRATASCFRYSR